MNNEQRKIRYDAAIAELSEFCRLFGFGLKMPLYDRYDDNARSVVLTYSRGETVCDVMKVDPTRSYGRSYTKPYAVLEKALTKLRNGTELKWAWSKIESAEGGSVMTTYTRTYRLPKFSSIQELKILLMARGSEFIGKDEATT